MKLLISLVALFALAVQTHGQTINGQSVRLQNVPPNAIVNVCKSSTGSDTFTCSVNSSTRFAYVDGMQVLFWPTGAACSGSATINMSSKGAKKLFAEDGSSDPECEQNRRYWITYDASLDSSAGAWVMPAAGGGGSGMVGTGVAGCIAYYPSNGTTVDDAQETVCRWKFNTTSGALEGYDDMGNLNITLDPSGTGQWAVKVATVSEGDTGEANIGVESNGLLCWFMEGDFKRCTGASTIEAHFPVTSTGIKACAERLAAGTITSAKLSVDDGIPTGANLVVDVLTVAAATYASGGAAGASSIAASAKPTITTGGGVYSVTDSTLTGWTTAVSANTVFCIEVETAPTGGATMAHLILTLE